MTIKILHRHSTRKKILTEQAKIDSICAKCQGGFRFSGCPKNCEYYGKAFKKPERNTAEEEAQLARTAPIFEAIVVPPQSQTSRMRGFTIHRNNSGPEYAEVKLKRETQELAVFRLAKNEIFRWTGDIIIRSNETVTLESDTQVGDEIGCVFIDNVMLESLATLESMHQFRSGSTSFVKPQPMQQYNPPQQSSPHGMRIPLPDGYIPAPEQPEKKAEIDPRIKGLIDSLEERKRNE